VILAVIAQYTCQQYGSLSAVVSGVDKVFFVHVLALSNAVSLLQVSCYTASVSSDVDTVAARR